MALAHSALHNLTIPHIYSRFDIVWPDSHTTPEPRVGVDALTYGLATLVMGEETLDESTSLPRDGHSSGGHHYTCKECGTVNQLEDPVRPRTRRRGNQYAQYTRKFSLGNGPPDWVQEYLITKEGGKMLGTLVALAVARMPNLETFTWDMPTGVLRDVWLALASLADQRSCRLQRIWVRWHDNSENSMISTAAHVPETVSPPHPPPTAGPNLPAAGASSQAPPTHGPSVPTASGISPLAQSLSRVEHPTFSILPTLRSLNVLDIDELAYLDEMGILIGRSKHVLRELRVGIASHAEKRQWVTERFGDDSHVTGVLSTLMRHVHDDRRHSSCVLLERSTTLIVNPLAVNAPSPSIATVSDTGQVATPQITTPNVDGSESTSLQDQRASPTVTNSSGSEHFTSTARESAVSVGSSDSLQGPDQLEAVNSDPATSNEHTTPDVAANVSETSRTDGTTKSVNELLHKPANESKQALRPKSDSSTATYDAHWQSPTKLELEVLELERVPLVVPIIQRVINISTITSLTILHCPEHEQFWKTLRRIYLPRSLAPPTTLSKAPSYPSTSWRTSTADASHVDFSEYRLNLKRIHTDAVSMPLISFLKDTLAPNSLESLFLQEGRPYSSTVSIDAIYRGPLRRHKASLRKLMIDSSDRTNDGRPAPNNRWKKWVLNREALKFVTSGKMSALRELAIGVDYKDWVSVHPQPVRSNSSSPDIIQHFFLQRLPDISHLRSLYIPYVSNHLHPDPRELALQIVDIIALRPEVDICYIGISTKCFEVLENKHLDERHSAHDASTNVANAGPGGVEAYDHADSDDEDDEDDEDEDEEDAIQVATPATTSNPDDAWSDAVSDVQDDLDEDGDSDGTEEDTRKPRLRLREILFYDDKVSIFKARHGRL